MICWDTVEMDFTCWGDPGAVEGLLLLPEVLDD
jgi:hypothetical protein